MSPTKSAVDKKEEHMVNWIRRRVAAGAKLELVHPMETEEIKEKVCGEEYTVEEVQYTGASDFGPKQQKK
jgi:hypothetical protein